MSDHSNGPASDDPGYSLESSFYGPGAIWCWYLTLFSAVITLFVDQSSNPPALKTTFDLIGFIIYPSLAAGHLVRQISITDARYIPELAKSIRLIGSDNKHNEINQSIYGLNAPIQVCLVYLLASAIIIISLACKPRHRTRPIRKKLLPWTLFISELWILSCLVYLTVRSQETTIIWKLAGIFLVLICILIGCMIIMIFLCVFFFCFIRPPSIMLSELSQAYAPWYGSDGPFYLRVPDIFGVLLGFSYIGGTCIAVIWCSCSLLWPFRIFLIPDVPVEMSALDQISALLLGMLAVLFNIYKSFLDGNVTGKFGQAKRWLLGYFGRRAEPSDEEHHLRMLNNHLEENRHD